MIYKSSAKDLFWKALLPKKSIILRLFQREKILKWFGCAQFSQIFELSRTFLPLVSDGKKRGKFQNPLKIVRILVSLLSFLPKFTSGKPVVSWLNESRKQGRFRRWFLLYQLFWMTAKLIFFATFCEHSVLNKDGYWQ